MSPDWPNASSPDSRRAGAPKRGAGTAAATFRPCPQLIERRVDDRHLGLAAVGAGGSLTTSALLIVTAATCYNAVLAIVNAHGVPIGIASVAITEALILTAAGVMIVKSGRRPLDSLGFLLLALFLVDALIVSIASGTPYVTMARNGTIIALFLMLGARVDAATLKRCFLLCAILVFAVLLLELLAVKAYAGLFAPSLYFERTRGVAPFELDELGLFRNALSFSGRFSISNLSDHRTASLFLEQVSLANFSTVLVIYLAAMWQRLNRGPKLFYIALILLILLTNNSRTGLFIALIAPLVYWLAPRLNRFAPLAIMPGVLIAATIVAISLPISYEDTFSGRVGLAIRALAAADLPTMLGSSAPLAIQFPDSGYAFLLYSMSLAGLVAFWLMVSLILVTSGASQRRCALLIGLYIFCNLLIGATAVFTIKVASLLWLLVGFLRREGMESPAELVPESPDAPFKRFRFTDSRAA